MLFPNKIFESVWLNCACVNENIGSFFCSTQWSINRLYESYIYDQVRMIAHHKLRDCTRLINFHRLYMIQIVNSNRYLYQLGTRLCALDQSSWIIYRTKNKLTLIPVYINFIALAAEFLLLAQSHKHM